VSLEKKTVVMSRDSSKEEKEGKLNPSGNDSSFIMSLTFAIVIN
jgi:hypothetical protein